MCHEGIWGCAASHGQCFGVVTAFSTSNSTRAISLVQNKFVVCRTCEITWAGSVYLFVYMHTCMCMREWVHVCVCDVLSMVNKKFPPHLEYITSLWRHVVAHESLSSRGSLSHIMVISKVCTPASQVIWTDLMTSSQPGWCGPLVVVLW